MAMDDDVKGPREYLVVVERRKLRFIIPTVIVFVIGAVIAYVIPPVYQSTGTVLIEEPEVPREFIQSTITSFAAQRLQVIQQRVITTQNLIGIINKFNLYQEERRRKPISEVAANFRDKMAMELVSAEVAGPRGQQQTIAFTVSFEDGDRRVAQQVANELVSLYLNENLRDRREKAAETTGFLAEEAKRLGESVGEMEAKLAEFKRNNAGQLPEQLDLNLQLIRRTESELLESARRLQLLEHRRITLQSELTQLVPHGPRVVDGQTILSPPERLKALQTKYISMRGVYGENHPDVAKMRREIGVLKKETGGGTDANALKEQLKAVTDEISVARKRYGAKHPDVVNLERQIKSLRSAIKEAGNSKSKPTYDPEPDNPAYIMAQGQLKTVASEIRSVKKLREELRTNLKVYEERVLGTPEIERRYLALRRDYENGYTKYKDVKAKQLEAQLAQSLETERKSERFSLIEPPPLPLEPVRPNRLAIVFIGLVFAGAIGVGNVFLAESMDETVYGAKQLSSVIGHQPLVVVPVINDGTEKKRTRWWLWLGVPCALLVLVGVLAAFHNFVTPLDVFWFSKLRRFGLN